ncbi:MAG: hypothetical protein LBR64_03350 [Dysgonamonadaceae bacterium]|jgi:hypothetical protein|nr:hypothetical protein [Dysgonamonadaceae bacterium]
MKKTLSLLLFVLALSFPAAMSAQNQERDKHSPVIAVDSLMPEMNVANNRLYLKNAPVGRRVDVITIIGNKVKEIEITASEGVYDLNLRRGVYIFKLDGLVRKFLVR